nr:MAG TPA: hypothetical protein [Caudoviricetes sp.]
MYKSIQIFLNNRYYIEHIIKFINKVLIKIRKVLT